MSGKSSPGRTQGGRDESFAWAGGDIEPERVLLAGIPVVCFCDAAGVRAELRPGRRRAMGGISQANRGRRAYGCSRRGLLRRSRQLVRRGDDLFGCRYCRARKFRPSGTTRSAYFDRVAGPRHKHYRHIVGWRWKLGRGCAVHGGHVSSHAQQPEYEWLANTAMLWNQRARSRAWSYPCILGVGGVVRRQRPYSRQGRLQDACGECVGSVADDWWAILSDDSRTGRARLHSNASRIVRRRVQTDYRIRDSLLF